MLSPYDTARQIKESIQTKTLEPLNLYVRCMTENVHLTVGKIYKIMDIRDSYIRVMTDNGTINGFIDTFMPVDVTPYVVATNDSSNKRLGLTPGDVYELLKEASQDGLDYCLIELNGTKQWLHRSHFKDDLVYA